MVHDELAACTRPSYPEQTVVPERPWLATQRLMAALTVQLEEAGEGEHILDPALSLESRGAPVALRVPVRAAEQAALSLSLYDGRIQGVALDRRGVSWVQVGDGGVTVERLRRPSLLRDVLDGHVPLLVWATHSSRCHEHSCQHQTTGVAWLRANASSLPEPNYLGAHPAGTVRNVVLHAGTDLWIGARRERGAELVRFSGLDPAVIEPVRELAEPADSEVPAAVEVVDAVDAALVRAPDESFGTVEGGTFLVHPTGAEPAARLVYIHEGEVRAEGERLWSGPAQWLERAGNGVFAGGRRTVYLGWGRTFAIDAPSRLNDRRTAGNRGHTIAGLAGQTQEGLLVARCDPRACHSHLIAGVDVLDADAATAVASLFDIAVFGEQVLVALVREGQVSVMALNADGTLDSSSVPADCLSETGGFCGAPAFAADASRVVLGVRDGTDLLLVQSVDGRVWEPGALGVRP